MTELEQTLLSALEQQKEQFLKQHNDYVKGHNNLLEMFKATSSENAQLREQVTSLNNRINGLEQQLSDLIPLLNRLKIG